MADELEYDHRAERDVHPAECRVLGRARGHESRHNHQRQQSATDDQCHAPSNNATLSGAQYLDAIASAGVTKVQYQLTGGNLSDSVIAAGTPTIYGWLTSWNTSAVPNGTYTLQSVAFYAGGVSGASTPIAISVTN